MGGDACYYFFTSSFFMADNKFNDWLEYQQRSGGGVAFHTTGVRLQLPSLKRITEMAQIKWALIICDWLGIPVTVLGIWANMTNVKSTILFIIASAYLMLRAYYYAIRQQQEARARDIDNWHKEQDKEDRINKNKK